MTKSASRGTHALREIKPHLGVRLVCLARRILPALLIAHVRQNRTPQLTLIQPQGKRRQVRREGMHMLVVIEGVLAQVLARQLTRTPRFIKWMAKQVILRNALIKFLKKLLAGHGTSLLQDLTIRAAQFQ